MLNEFTCQNISFNNSISKLMVVDKNNKVEDYKFKKGNLNFAVIGHVEWINLSLIHI